MRLQKVHHYSTFDFSSKNQDFLPKNDQIWPEIGILPGLVGTFGALLVGWLVFFARGLYLARHLFTLLYLIPFKEIGDDH